MREAPGARLPYRYARECRGRYRGGARGELGSSLAAPVDLLWSAILFAVFCPLAVRAYGRQE
ncbi:MULTISPECIES: hypothetical protein [unclassified Streptomyces]|uniref:hypothetical protein n=1 Tax=unclassified Streptomyces TaxID=2593676 RepID=UPI0033BC81DE